MDSNDAEASAEDSVEDLEDQEGSKISKFVPSRLAVPMGVLVFVLLVDQISKSWAVDRLSDGSTFDVALGLKFRLAYNTGMAFSQGQDSGAIIGTIATVVAVGVIVYSMQFRSVWIRVLLGLVAGGALGNVADRLFRSSGENVLVAAEEATGFMKGAVVDFIYTSFWPTFNIADSAVVVGAILLVITLWREESAEGESVEAVAPTGSETATAQANTESDDS